MLEELLEDLGRDLGRGHERAVRAERSPGHEEVDVRVEIEEAPEGLDRGDAARLGVLLADRLPQGPLDDAVGGE